ncbi:MAG: hypothetical protein U0670_15380 [Anaerolineae bacterium]
MNNRRTLFALTAIFFVLIVVTLIVQNRPQTPAVPDVTPFFFRVYPDLSADDLQALRIQNLITGEELSIARDEENQWISPEGIGQVNQETANNLALTLSLLPYTQTLTNPTTADLESFGLRPRPVLLISAVTSDGQGIAVAVGNRTLPNTSYYAIIDDRPDVYVLERAAVDYLAISARTSTPIPESTPAS